MVALELEDVSKSFAGIHALKDITFSVESGQTVSYTHLDSTWEQIQKLTEEAIENKTASICIPPTYIKRVNDKYGDKINICTVIGFPLGYLSLIHI